MRTESCSTGCRIGAGAKIDSKMQKVKTERIIGAPEGRASSSRTTYRWIVSSGSSSTVCISSSLLLRSKLCSIVEVNNLLIADVNNHVNLPVPVHILKFQVDRYRISIVSVEC